MNLSIHIFVLLLSACCTSAVLKWRLGSPRLILPRQGRFRFLKKETIFPCALQNFKVLTYCCRNLPITFFPSKDLFKCNYGRTDLSLFSVATDYVFNKLQNPRIENQVDINSRGLENRLGATSCFAQCLFKKNKLIRSDGKINMTGTKMLLKKPLTKRWVPIMEDAISKCDNVLKGDSMVDNIRSISYYSGSLTTTCSTEYAFLLQCVRKFLITACPENMFLQTPVCLLQQRNFEVCDIFPPDGSTSTDSTLSSDESTLESTTFTEESSPPQ